MARALRLNPIAIRRAIYADGWLGRYRRRVRRALDAQTRRVARRAAAGEQVDIGDAEIARWAAEMDRVKRDPTHAMVRDGFALAGQEFHAPAKALGRSPGPDTPMSIAVGEGEEFLVRADFKDVDQWVETTSLSESRTSAKKLEKIFVSASRTVKKDKEGRVRGATPKEIARAILRQGLADNRGRADMLARTGTIWAFNEGAQQRYKAEGVTVEEWMVTADDVTCFVRNTAVSIPRGVKPIYEVRAGDLVLTRSGPRQVVQTMSRTYVGKLITLAFRGGTLTCTHDHPIWVKLAGWRKAEDIRAGDVLNLAYNEESYVLGTFDFSLSDPDDRPSFAAKVLRLARVPLRVLMPVFSVYFKDELRLRQREVRAVPADLQLLNELGARGRQRETDSGLDSGLTVVLPIARNRAELHVRRRHGSERFSAVGTGNVLRRAVALLRAVFQMGATSEEHFSAAGARADARKAVSTGPTTDCHPMSDASKDRERLPARTAGLRHPLALNELEVTGAGAEPFPSRRLCVCVEGLPTRLARLTRSLFRGLVVATPTAVDALVRLAELLAALLTATYAGARHVASILPVYYIMLRGNVKVYNLEIEGDHTFYANGVLVHNCPYCRRMDGRRVRVDESFMSAGEEMTAEGPTGKPQTLGVPHDVQHPPLHPRCRCTMVPVLPELPRRV